MCFYTLGLTVQSKNASRECRNAQCSCNQNLNPVRAKNMDELLSVTIDEVALEGREGWTLVSFVMLEVMGAVLQQL